MNDKRAPYKEDPSGVESIILSKIATRIEGANLTNLWLLFESIRRFKGLQAAAVLLVDVDPRPDRDVDLKALYCGMSRATVHLEMFAQRDNAFNKEKLLRS